MLNPDICRKARLSRDRRFDGRFFVAVKTTGIYCRPICPATAPLENNVLYFMHAIEAAQAGFRPCLRCRPDSAPQSPAWQGAKTTLNRAVKLIKEGALQDGKLDMLAMRLGIGERYLRELFNKHLGTSPKAYALYQQGLLAKQLLHQTQLPITQVALASGFNSVRRFNDYFQSELKLTPSAIRKQKATNPSNSTLQITLSYRPPYDWTSMLSFLTTRAISKLEWYTENSYGRSFQLAHCQGNFTAHHIAEKSYFLIDLNLDNIKYLQSVISHIRRILDLDADMQTIEHDLSHAFPDLTIVSGLRLPGIWSTYEAGVRAILGQQVTIKMAHKLVTTLVDELGEPAKVHGKIAKLFPTPINMHKCDFDFLKMPASRKQTLRNFTAFYLENTENLRLNDLELEEDLDAWLAVKGIGLWAVNYAKMRGLSHPDIFLTNDAGVNNALAQLNSDINPEMASPWGSYLTLQLWKTLQ
ncbi:DNA-3-methyladenine glycosylase 2 family protein [Marinomonas agarivorans]|nr:DNA-3-methyladenine glycosylase 2 family protein [Marinomonas agarivorans]